MHKGITTKKVNNLKNGTKWNFIIIIIIIIIVIIIMTIMIVKEKEKH